MSTYMAKAETVERKWYVLDAAGKPMGRVAAAAATILRGKHRPEFTPHVDCGEFVIIINADKAVLTGSPFREELAKGNGETGRALCGFSTDKPVIMVIGGSLGSLNVNRFVRAALPLLLEDFQIVHLCGKDKVDNMLLKQPGYKQFEYLKSELKDIFAMADIVVSRAGANAICELLALNKPNILIPLPSSSSRGDQLLNAKSFEAQGFSIVIDEDDLSEQLLAEKIQELYFTKQTYIDAMSKSNQSDAINTIVGLIEDAVREK